MHRNFKSSLILLSLILLIIAGCDTEQTSSLAGPYQGLSGNKMIEANFVSDAPISLEADPYRKGEPVDVIVELRNKHTEDIPQGSVRLRLTGDAAIPNFFEGSKGIVTAPLLQAYDTEIDQATTEEVDLGPIVYVGDLPVKTSKRITAQYCYEYPVKVKGFLYYTDSPTDIGENLPSGSNPPSSVEVMKIDQQAVDVRDGVGGMRFRVTVKNVGTGTLVPSLSDCFTYRGRREREYLTITASGAYPITCEDDGVVRLGTENKEKVVTCEVTGIDPANLNNLPSELTLTLSGFAYEDNVPATTIWLEP